MVVRLQLIIRAHAEPITETPGHLMQCKLREGGGDILWSFSSGKERRGRGCLDSHPNDVFTASVT